MSCNCELVEGPHEYSQCVPILNARTKAWNDKQKGYPLRKSSIRKSRNKPRPGRLKGSDMSELRVAAHDRDRGYCVACGRHVVFTAPIEADDSMHLAHRRNKRMWGDSLDNVDTQCGKCHRLEHAYGKDRIKPCPAKQSVYETPDVSPIWAEGGEI